MSPIFVLTIKTMKKKQLIYPFTVALTTAVIIAGLVAGCSDDKPKTAAKNAAHNPFDHTHDKVVTDVVKHQFEHQFADQCVEREVKNAVNKEEERKRLAEPCMCIATNLMKDLTAEEAEKFLKERKDTQSLRIRFENAAYNCLQKQTQAQIKSPKLFGKQTD